MNVGHFRNWLRRRPSGASKVQLAQETPLGMQPLAEWTADEVAKGLEHDAGDAEIAALMQAEAQAVCDASGEVMKFFFRWIGPSGAPTTLYPVKLQVSKELREQEEPAERVRDPLVRELLGHIAVAQRQQNASLATLTTSYERMFNLLGSALENAHKRLAELQVQQPAQTAQLVQREPTSEEREESLQRARALEAVTGKIPDVIDAAVAALVTHFVPQDKAH